MTSVTLDYCDIDPLSGMTRYATQAQTLGIPSIALVGALTMTGALATAASNVVELPPAIVAVAAGDATMLDAATHEPQSMDLADRDVTLSDLTRWAQSMAGGDTSHMLDI